MKFLPAALANLAALCSALGFGSLIRNKVPDSFSGIDRLALILLAGIGSLGTLLFCVGQVWFSRTSILLILLLGISFGLKSLISVASQIRMKPPELAQSVLPAVIIGAVLLVTIVGGFAEPTGDIRMDAIAYHLLGPKVWLQAGLIRPVTDECMTAFPAAVETQFAAVMALGGQRAPQLFSVIALCSLLFMSASLALRMGLSSSGAWWVSALVASMPVVYRGAYGGFIDVIYSGLALAAIRIAFDASKPRHYFLAGAFCGFAVGTKYFGIFVWALLIICVYVLAARHKKREAKGLLRNLGITSAAALIIGAPWYLRNWIELGSPIYPPTPFLAHFFHARYLSPLAIQNFNDFFAKVRDGMGRGPLAFLLLPFNLTFHPANFMNGIGGIGLTPLAFAPFGLFQRRQDEFAQGLALFALLQTAAWFAIGQDPRYIIHVFIIGAIFAVYGWKYVVHVAPTRGPILCAMIVLFSVAYGFCTIVLARVNDLHAVISASYAEKRRVEEIPFVESFDFLNREPSATKILVLEPLVPVFYLDKEYLRPIGRFGEQSLPEAANLPFLMSELPRLHISHVLDVKFPDKTFRLPDNSRGLTLVRQYENQRIYRVNSLSGEVYLH
ncbi:MAG TPA: hypothetical protein VNX66_10670 [Candidatus Sulfotelmatobacter sp.]|nr:hypothetical protein [Candidatus Sulfotelmatobacter sp.]